MKTFLVIIVLLCTGCEALKERLRIERAVYEYYRGQDEWYNDHKKEVDEFESLRKL